MQNSRVAVLARTKGGQELAAKMVAGLDSAVLLDTGPGVARVLREHWRRFGGFVCIMAAGIVVRAVAPLLADKRQDPCVVVMDEKGGFAVSLLSGHLGGGNRLARQAAAIAGGRAVITTASDTLGLTAVDLWARSQGLAADNPGALTRASAALVNNGTLKLYSEVRVENLPTDFSLVGKPDEADLILSFRSDWSKHAPVLRPRVLVVGVGCNRGVTVPDLDEAVRDMCRARGLARAAIRNLASIDLKQDEEGLLVFANDNGWNIDFFGKGDLNKVAGVSRSDAALKATGAIGVAEPAALLSAGTDELTVRKMKWRNVTLAVARANSMLSAPDQEI